VSYIDNQDGTVTDTSTGLMWQKVRAIGTYMWQNALQYCKSLELAGYNDWRLPSREELQRMIDYGDSDSVFVVESGWYWSSSIGFPGYAWGVDSYDGSAGNVSKDGDGFVRAVRGPTGKEDI